MFVDRQFLIVPIVVAVMLLLTAPLLGPIDANKTSGEAVNVHPAPSPAVPSSHPTPSPPHASANTSSVEHTLHFLSELRSLQHSESAPAAAADEPASRSRSMARWTAIIYIGLDNDLDDYPVDFIEVVLNELQKIGSSDELNILVLADGHDYEGDTHAYYVAKNRLIEIALTDIDPNWVAQEVNMGDGKTLERFVTYVLEHYPAEHTLLELCSHGGGWRGVVWDETSGNDYITMVELRDALGTITAHAGRPIDILIFAACYMAEFSVYYNMEPYVSYVIASEQLVIPVPGYHYEGLRHLTSDLSLPPREVALNIYNAIMRFYRRTGTTLSLSVAALEEAPTLANALDNAANIFMDTPHLDALIDARNASEAYSDGWYVDLHDFATRARAEMEELNTSKSAVVDRALDRLLAAHHRFVIAYDWTNGGVGVEYHVEAAYGLSLFHPEYTPTTWDGRGRGRYGYGALRIANETTWDEYLAHLLHPRPVAVIDAPQRAAVDEAVVLDAARSVDFDAELVEYRWDLDADDNSSAYRYGRTIQHRFTTPGNYTIELRVISADGGAATTSTDLTVFQPNRGPYRIPDAETALRTEEDTPLFVNLSHLFIDPDGDTLYYTLSNATTDSANISVTFAPNATAQLTPRANWYGTAAVSFFALDQRNDPSFPPANCTLIIHVTPLNDPPQISPMPPIIVRERESVNFTIEANDIDANDTLSYFDNSTLFSIDRQSGRVKFTPQREDVGAHLVNITVRDRANAEASLSIHVTVLLVNRAPSRPTITAPQHNDTYFSTDLVWLRSTPGTDPDDDPLSYEWSTKRAGTIATGRSATHRFSPGQYELFLTVRDPHGGENTSTLTFRVLESASSDADADADNEHDEDEVEGEDKDKDEDEDGAGDDSAGSSGPGAGVGAGAVADMSYMSLLIVLSLVAGGAMGVALFIHMRQKTGR